MKKLLLIAILMLALVLTVVACTNEPTTSETTAGETTAADAPADTTAEPADETTAADAPADTTAEPPADDTTVATPVETTEPPVETPEPATTEAPVDPADPVWIIDADGLAAMTNANAATVEKNEDGYASFTAVGDDPWFLVTGNIGAMPEYLVLSYRTNTTQMGEFFTGNGAGPEGGKSFTYNYNANGEWNLLVFHLPTVASYMTDNTIGHIRFDFYTGGPEEGAFLDVDYIAFFNTAEYAEAYHFAKHPAYVSPAEGGQTAVSFDTFKVNGEMYFEQDGEAGAKLDAINNTVSFSADQTVETVTLRGWIGFSQPIEAFGYYIDDPYAQTFGEFKAATEDAIFGIAGEHATRFEINVPVADLESGTHTIGYLAKLADGTVVRLRGEITLVIVPENIALNKPTDATTMQGGVPFDVSAPMATDGDDTTRWAAEPTVPSDLIVDLQGLCTLTQIHVSLEQAMMNYTISVSEDGENYTVVYEGAAGGFASEPIIVDVELDNVSARYVKVSTFGEGGNYFSIWELCVYGEQPPAEPTNVALNRPATATSVQGGSGMVGEFAVDGNDTTRWASEPTVPSDLIVDFQGLCALTQITVSFEQAMMDYTISVSEDGENYTVVYEGTRVEFITTPLVVTVDLENISARYVKVSSFGEGGNYFSVWELTAMGVALEDIPEIPVNIALNKTATATSTQESHVAQNAIDGDMSTRWGAEARNACDLTVDLEGIYSLNEIVVVFEQAMMEYTISVSEDGENYVVVYEGAREGFASAPITKTVELDDVNVRYVKVSRLQDDGSTDFWFSIWELSAMGVAAE